MDRNNSNSRSVLLLLFVILYVLSPVDAAPGPVDDFIVMMLPLFFGGSSKGD